MTECKIIMNRLLDKYEKSKHFSMPGMSSRRVMLRVSKNELPEYKYEEASVRDAFNWAARELECRQLIQAEWIKDRPLISNIVLNLKQVMECYAVAGRIHPKIRASHLIEVVNEETAGIEVSWISAWVKELCEEAKREWKVPAFCKKDESLLKDLLIAFKVYGSLSESVTMRAFSSKCFCDTKYFERNVRDLFLRIARKYDTELISACEENELGDKEQLAVLGIYTRPELYELAGDCTIKTRRGDIEIGAASSFGMALPSTLVDLIVGIDLEKINCITFIENKTNYDEYLISEKKPEELVVYHGGFLSPQKKKLFNMLMREASKTVTVRFWADIDLGGFRMFKQLQMLFPDLQPMRMSGRFVTMFRENGLKRSETYLDRIRADAQSGEYSMFQDAISEILKYKITIEQEVFLN